MKTITLRVELQLSRKRGPRLTEELAVSIVSEAMRWHIKRLHAKGDVRLHELRVDVLPEAVSSEAVPSKAASVERVKWIRGPDRSLIYGRYSVVVVGEDSGGRAKVWEVKKDGQSLPHRTVKGRPISGWTYSVHNDAKRKAKNLHQADEAGRLDL